jgi:zinc transporter
MAVQILADHPQGLLWGFRFQEGSAAPIFHAPVPADLQANDGWIWAHFPLSDQRSRHFLAHMQCLPPPAVELLLGSEDSPRILFKDAWAFGILPDFEKELDGRVTGLGRLRFAFDDKRLITVRRHAILVADDIHGKLTAGRVSFAGPLDAFIALNKTYCEIAEDQLEDLADKMDSIEDKVLGDGDDLEDLPLGSLRRDLSRRHREIASLRTAYRRAASRQPHAQAHALGPHLQSLEQLGEDLDRTILALQDRARLIHEDIDTKITSATSRTLRTLTIISVILMPPTLIVGAFGMNLDGILFAKSPHGFAVISGLCVLTVVGALAILRGRRIWK